MTTASDIRSSAVSAFVAEWFELLSKHVSVDRITEFLAPDGVEMVFPERTLHGLDDFRDWYADVGRAYADQTHEVERVLTSTTDARTEAAVVVVWRAVQTSDGAALAFRARQDWRLRPTPGTTPFAIVRYQVVDMTAI